MTTDQITTRLHALADELLELSEMIELLKTVSSHESPDTLTVTAFQNAMVQQAKDFGFAIDSLQKRVDALEAISAIERN